MSEDGANYCKLAELMDDLQVIVKEIPLNDEQLLLDFDGDDD